MANAIDTSMVSKIGNHMAVRLFFLGGAISYGRTFYFLIRSSATHHEAVGWRRAFEQIKREFGDDKGRRFPGCLPMYARNDGKWAVNH